MRIGENGIVRGFIAAGLVGMVVGLGAAPGATAGPPACALGTVPSELRTPIASALAREHKRFATTLGALGARDRSRALATFDTGVAAYLFGMPNVLIRLTIKPFPTNALVDVGRLSTPESQGVVAPNHDTLYSTTRLDLAGGPMVISAPATGGRYSVVQLMDMNTDVIGYLGTTGRAETVAVVPPGWVGAVPAGIRKVQSTSSLVWLLGRTLVDGDGDAPGATALMTRYRTATLADWVAGRPTAPKVIASPQPRPPTVVPAGLAFFDSLGAALAADPPRPQDACALRAFRAAGITAGATPSTSADPVTARALTAAVAAGSRVTDVGVTAGRRISQRRNAGWSGFGSDAGRFETDYVSRAVIARSGLGANTPEEAIYPNTDVDRRGQLLDGHHDYTVTFPAGELPPVREFWSMTLYDRDLSLVANDLGRYSIGDRTAGLRYGKGRSLTVYVQHRPPAGPRRANWLPAPKGRFLLYLRLYRPKAAATDGRWRPPAVIRAR